MILAKNDPLRRWLERATPEERHLFVAGWDSEAAAVVWDWVIRQPDCEKATALMAYWLRSPVYFAEHGAPEKDDPVLLADYRLLREIEKRYVTGFYQRHSIGFDPANVSQIPEERIDLTDGYAEITPVEPIPAEMFVPIEGREPIEPEGWEDGIPAEVAKVWSDYLEREEWKQLARTRTSLYCLTYGLAGSALCGSLGFAVPELLPLIVNQDLQLRSIVTGALGFLLGGIVGALYGLFKAERSS